MKKYSYILNGYYDTQDAAAVFRNKQVCFYIQQGIPLIDIFFDEHSSTLFHVFWKKDSSEAYRKWKNIEKEVTSNG